MPRARKATSPPPRKAATPRKTAAPRRPRALTHEVQAATEGVVLEEHPTVEMGGRRFRVAETIGMMPLLKFAHHANIGLDTDSMQGMAAVYAMLRDCIDRQAPYAELVDGQRPDSPKILMLDPEDEETVQRVADGEIAKDGKSEWEMFERHAIDCKAEGEDLLAVVNQAIELISARPTRPPGSSSAGRPTTSRSLKATSSSAGSGPSPEELAALTPVSEFRRR